VGEATVNDGPGVVEATSDGGVTWSTQSAPSSSLEFKGIACPAAGACIAVGDGPYTSGGIVIGQAPTTFVGLPSNGATVSGHTWLDAGAQSPVGLASVTFEVSGGSVSDQVVGSAVPTLYGWICGWDTTDVPKGTYSLHSVATDTSGVSTTSAGITVTVNNSPPSTAVLVPSSGASVSGQRAVLDASASGPGHITSVQFVLNGGSLSNALVATGTPTLYGYLAQWDTTGVANGTYTLRSEVAEAGGTTAMSPGITVTVDNPPLTTGVLVPSSGATLSGAKAVLDASASGPGHITSVQFVLNGGSLSNALVATGVPTLYGYLAQWDTTGVANGTYTLQSVATETEGPTAASPPVTVSVSN
jgi:hypothetical protein